MFTSYCHILFFFFFLPLSNFQVHVFCFFSPLYKNILTFFFSSHFCILKHSEHQKGLKVLNERVLPTTWTSCFFFCFFSIFPVVFFFNPFFLFFVSRQRPHSLIAPRTPAGGLKSLHPSVNPPPFPSRVPRTGTNYIQNTHIVLTHAAPPPGKTKPVQTLAQRVPRSSSAQGRRHTYTLAPEHGYQKRTSFKPDTSMEI